jgi:hypothetical protein
MARLTKWQYAAIRRAAVTPEARGSAPRQRYGVASAAQRAARPNSTWAPRSTAATVPAAAVAAARHN